MKTALYYVNPKVIRRTSNNLAYKLQRVFFMDSCIAFVKNFMNCNNYETNLQSRQIKKLF